MAYTPAVKQSSSYGDKGQAKVLVNTKNTDRILVKMRAQNWNKSTKQMDYEVKEFKLLRSDCPDEVQSIIHTTDNAFVRVSSKGDKIYQFSPWVGQFEGHFVGFSVAKGETVAPKTFKGADWQYDYMTALVEITSGQFKGAVVPYMLRYHFAEGSDGEVLYDHGKSKYTAQLMEFLEITGAWEKGAMKYKDNVLPMLQKRMLEADRKFKFVVKDGNIAVLFASGDPVTEELEEEE